MFKRIKREILPEVIAEMQERLEVRVPVEPEAFYRDFGPLRHPMTRKPVPALAPYQLALWRAFQKYRRILCIKSNKVGLTTSSLIMDFQLAMLPSSNPMSCRGYDQLLIAQTIPHAREHLYTLRKLIMNSRKYRDFLISKPTELVLRDEITKVTVLFIKNPDNPYLPSRIIGLGASNSGSILSWKNVKHIHVSDLVATEGEYMASLHAAMSRLANTFGSMILETIPDFAGSPLHQMYEKYSEPERPYLQGDFYTMTVTAEEGLEAGVITPEHLASERDRLGPLFPKYYGASFLHTGNAWYDPELFQYYDNDAMEVTL